MSRPKVFVPNRIPVQALRYLQEHCEVDYRDVEEKLSDAELIDGLEDAEGLMIYSRQKIHASILEHAPRLKVVSNIAVGYDNLDLKELTMRGIMGTNTPGVLTETTADLTFSILTAAARRIAEADHFVKSGQWEGWMPSLLLGKNIYGSTLGIIGMGRIGEAVARRAKGFDMNILYYNRSRKSEAEEMLGVAYSSLDDLLQQSDYVVVLVPLSPSSTRLISEREFRMMKRDAIFVNVSRGPTVDEQALIHALQEGWIAGAALDVFEKEPVDKNNPLLQMPNVVTVPHIGSATLETRSEMAVKAAKNLIAGVTGQIPMDLVNPDVIHTTSSQER
ncbi:MULTISPECIES: D-glycerate dehydrogenase [unclassified Paenibacillus]|uniref:2-hydroxyacid dehydrogenase n=1 Tax=unclassified Paenibacillus TaxID=185978 RepID=UPI001AE4EA50|nr:MULTISPECIES: D-glycerate dehydrogenase [unclassified Paenibacillus]MBP1155809.1 glyoxylate reductase/gluconate 2-dehydrogenase [Paenibacillus sp. PvP091]MBP1168805.1 glyoxylate reductase/gluconate 2-dehydrogenase [Paenibacillus sp. PvR098]MBP2439833.1 glyoxylate reductase/gluconate 2-dehydrogenase [Paenibacillus sp. PvP052]